MYSWVPPPYALWYTFQWSEIILYLKDFEVITDAHRWNLVVIMPIDGIGDTVDCHDANDEKVVIITGFQWGERELFKVVLIKVSLWYDPLWQSYFDAAIVTVRPVTDFIFFVTLKLASVMRSVNVSFLMPKIIKWTKITIVNEIRCINIHYNDVIMTTIASQITSLAVVYSIVYSGADQRKHQTSASLAFVWGIHRDRWIPRTKSQ